MQQRKATRRYDLQTLNGNKQYPPTKIMQTRQEITVKNLPIRLGQFLKLANLVQDGFEARIKIQEGSVLVNGNIETRRGKKLITEDTVTIDGDTWILKAG